MTILNSAPPDAVFAATAEDGVIWTLSWNAAAKSVTAVATAGDQTQAYTTQAVLTKSPTGSITFSISDEFGDHLISGKITASADLTTVTTDLDIAGQAEPVRIIAWSADVLAAQVSLPTVAKKKCVCFGLPGGTTGSCATEDCDTGESCGTAGNGTNKACRWVGKIFRADVVPIDDGATVIEERLE